MEQQIKYEQNVLSHLQERQHLGQHRRALLHACNADQICFAKQAQQIDSHAETCKATLLDADEANTTQPERVPHRTSTSASAKSIEAEVEHARGEMEELVKRSIITRDSIPDPKHAAGHALRPESLPPYLLAAMLFSVGMLMPFLDECSRLCAQ